MAGSSLDGRLEARSDGLRADAPVVTWRDKVELNKQSGFNRRLIEGAKECGCFHCCRRFPPQLVTDWMKEPGEEDTGLCPYCGVDALIVGSKEFPLSTGLLEALRTEWFEPLPKSKPKPPSNPPRPVKAGEEPLPLEVTLWSISNPDAPLLDCEGEPKPGVYTDVSLVGKWHLCVWEEELEDQNCEEDEVYWVNVITGPIEHFELKRDGVILRFSPWSDHEQASIKALCKKYGEELMAEIEVSDPTDIKMRVFRDG